MKPIAKRESVSTHNLFCPAAFVEIKSVEIVCNERPNGNINIDFADYRGEEAKKFEYTIKEKADYSLRVNFKVYNDIVQGLRFCSVVRKKGRVVDKDEVVVGAFSYLKEVQNVDIDMGQAPSGYFGRGTYQVVARFIDIEGTVHMQFEYNVRIVRQWTD
jgi:hypothetical protein